MESAPNLAVTLGTGSHIRGMVDWVFRTLPRAQGDQPMTNNRDQFLPRWGKTGRAKPRNTLLGEEVMGGGGGIIKGIKQPSAAS